MENITVNKEELIVMAVVAAAEEMHEMPENIRVLSFREVKESSLQRYLRDSKIQYNRFKLEVLQDDEI